MLGNSTVRTCYDTHIYEICFFVGVGGWLNIILFPTALQSMLSGLYFLFIQIRIVSAAFFFS